MKRILSLLLVVIASWVPATGLPTPAQVSNEALILGTWRIDGYLDQNKRRGRWYQEWAFGDGKFTQKGYPPLEQSGRYRIIGDEGDKLTLELYEQQGTFGNKNRRLEIVIDRQKDQLKIGSNQPFLRVKSKS
jgi:hypothetical protein